MSSIEERLVRDIAAVTEGVAMTESDLRDARTQMDERIEAKRQRERRRTVLAAAAAAVVVIAVGATVLQSLDGEDKTAPPSKQPSNVVDPDADFLAGQPPTSALINGLWRVDDGQILVLFDDGVVRFDDRGGVWSDPRTLGTYLIEGDTITVTATVDDPAGCRLTSMSMRASLPGRGAMHVVQTGSSVPSCWIIGEHEQWVLEQVLPANAGLAALDFSADEFQPVTDTDNLPGDWMAQGGGYVLELALNATSDGGSYSVAADSGDVIDQGDWSLSTSGRELELVSSRDSTRCDTGDRLVLGALVSSVVTNPTSAFRGSVQQNDCHGGWTPAAWILLPHGPR
jgi:hypothetical protein